MVLVSLKEKQIFQLLELVHIEEKKISNEIQENLDYTHKQTGDYIITFLNEKRNELKIELNELNILSKILIEKL